MRVARLLVVIGFFLIGFGVGTHPDLLRSWTVKPVTLYVEDPSLFPSNSLPALTAFFPVPVNIVHDNPGAADLWLVNGHWLQKPELQTHHSVIPAWNELFALISPDFQLQICKEAQALPVLWRVPQAKPLQIEILILLKNPQSSAQQKDQSVSPLAQTLLSKDFQNRWLQSHSWNSTLLKMDETELSEERKASHLRKLKLLNIKNCCKG